MWTNAECEECFSQSILLIINFLLLENTVFFLHYVYVNFGLVLPYAKVMELCRPSDSHLEHVDFECLFSCLSHRLLLRVFGSLLLERRIIFTADKLRSVNSLTDKQPPPIVSLIKKSQRYKEQEDTWVVPLLTWLFFFRENTSDRYFEALWL